VFISEPGQTSQVDTVIEIVTPCHKDSRNKFPAQGTDHHAFQTNCPFTWDSGVYV